MDRVKAQDSTTLIVEFTPVSGASGYLLRVENAQGHFSEEPVASSPVQVGSLQPHTAYSLSIMAVNSGGRSQPSSRVDATTRESCRPTPAPRGRAVLSARGFLVWNCFHAVLNSQLNSSLSIIYIYIQYIYIYSIYIYIQYIYT